MSVSTVCNLRALYDNAVSKGVPERPQEDGKCKFVIYRGFKIVREVGGNHLIYDVRFNDFYSKVSNKNMKILLSEGLVKGADSIMYSRDILRMEKMKINIASMYDKIEKVYQKNLDKGLKVEFYKKRIRNARSNIEYYLDLLFTYKARKELYERKYLNLK